MTAVILAAGIGRRMHPFSETCHKALLPIGDATILGRALDALKSYGVVQRLRACRVGGRPVNPCRY
jgi:NDP-sugar pyrophosphorylase family protein